MKQPQRLLTMRLSAMGDVAMTVPVLLAVKRIYPEVKLFSLSRKRFFPILQQVPDIVLIEADVNKRHHGIFGLRRLAMEIEKHQPDAIADLHNVLRTKTLRAFLRRITSAKINKGRKDKKRLVKDQSFFQQLQPTVERYADVLAALELPIELTPADVLPRLAFPEKVHRLVGDHDHRWIGFAPFAAHQAKSLSLGKAQELVQNILQIDAVKIVLFGGGESERKQLKTLAETNANVFNLAGYMSFEEELAMLSNLDAMVSVDTGNGHLAAMYGVPVITLWGNTHPFAGFVPFLQPAENQITVNREQFPLVPTSIYGNKLPGGYENVLETIDCAMVVARLRVLLK